MTLLVRNLSKRYEEQAALNSVDLTLAGGVVALLGANGSGKSTLLRILATLSKPDTGEIVLNGWTYSRYEQSLRGHIGYLPQSFDMPETFTPFKLLNYLAQLRATDANEIIRTLRIESFIRQPFSRLTGGQIRLVGIAQALLGKPALILLDEPGRGLDITEREHVYKVITEYSTLTFFSTHIPDEAERIAQTVIVLAKGRVIFSGSVDTLRSYAKGLVYEIDVPLNLSEERLIQITGSMKISRIWSTDATMLNPHTINQVS